MPYASSNFRERSERILRAGRAVRSKLGANPAQLSSAIDDLVKATSEDVAVLGWGPGNRPGAEPTFEDALCGTLLDLQSANLLLSAGAAVEHPDSHAQTGTPDQMMARAIVHVESVQNAALARQTPGLHFEGPASVTSADIAGAKATFDKRATATLDEVVNGAGDIIRGAFAGLAKLDPSQFSPAIDQLGQGSGFVAQTGRLVRLGLEKLKSAIDSLLSFVGEDRLARIKEALRKLWDASKPDHFVREILAHLLGVPKVRAEIDRLLEPAFANLQALDEASRELYAVSTEHAGRIRLLSGIVSATGYAAGVLGFVLGAAPWLPVAVAGSYAIVAGTSVLIGLDYVGSQQVLGWTMGVAQVVLRISPDPPAI